MKIKPEIKKMVIELMEECNDEDKSLEYSYEYTARVINEMFGTDYEGWEIADIYINAIKNKL